MKSTQLFDANQFYIIRAKDAGVFLGKIEKKEGSTILCNSLRRLYYWEGALDVTQIASNGVSLPGNCKFSVQMGENDKSIIEQLIEAHPVSEKALQSINSVPEWKR